MKQERDEAAEQRIRELGEQLEYDRTLVADCVTAAEKAVNGRHWLTEGRGCYEWNDDRWHEEFRAAALEFLAAIEPMRKVAADWKNCPQTSAEVAKSRIGLKARIAALEAQVAELQARNFNYGFIERPERFRGRGKGAAATSLDMNMAIAGGGTDTPTGHRSAWRHTAMATRTATGPHCRKRRAYFHRKRLRIQRKAKNERR